MHNLDQNVSTKAFVAAVYTGDRQIGSAINLQGEGGKVLAILSLGSMTSNSMTITFQESTDNSTWTTLDATTLAGLGSGSVGISTVDLTPTKKYIRAIVALTNTGTVGACPTYYALLAIVYNERYNPDNV